MGRKRPCGICRRWFVPQPRAGDRQRVCSAAACQQERHRRACADWRRREGEAERRHRLRQRLRVEPGDGGPQGVAQGGQLALRWDVVRDAVGLELSVIIEEVSRLLEDVVRDAVRRQPLVSKAEWRQVLVSARRDDIALGGGGP